MKEKNDRTEFSLQTPKILGRVYTIPLAMFLLSS